jgi:hypothetical protein
MGNWQWVMVANYQLLKISCKLITNAFGPNSQFPITNAQSLSRVQESHSLTQCFWTQFPSPNSQVPITHSQFPIPN